MRIVCVDGEENKDFQDLDWCDLLLSHSMLLLVVSQLTSRLICDPVSSLIVCNTIMEGISGCYV